MRLIRNLAVVLVCVLAPLPAAADWVRLRTEHFEFIGDAPARDIRRIARSLEQFREVMARVVPGAADAVDPPRVIVFRSQQAMAPFLRRFDGRTVTAGGLFVDTGDASYILMDGSSDAKDPLVFHEYTHYLVRRALPMVPVWVNEGLAEFYAQFQEREGGRAALLGAPDPDHLRVLRTQTPIPLDVLAAVDAASPMYNEGSRRGLFYAQSWALVHYLLMGKTRTEQFTAYIGAIRRGTPADEAFASTLGGDVAGLERELRDYITRFLFPVVTARFGDRVVGRADANPAPLPEPDAQGYLADLLARLGREDEARARFASLLSSRPDSAGALRAFGLMELRLERVGEAIELLERAAALRPDDPATLEALGRGLYHQSEAAIDRSERDRLTERARRALEDADARGPLTPAALSLLGYLEALRSSPESLARASEYLRRAIQLDPADQQLRLRLARVLVLRNELDAATSILGPLLASSTQRDVRESARDLLADVSALRRSSATADSDPPSPSSAPAAERPRSEEQPSLSGQNPRPILRPIAAGELQLRGRFRAIECGPGGIFLLIETNAGAIVRLQAKTLTDVDFITYRTDTPGQVNCGVVEPHPVLATYRELKPAASGLAGEAVAIEVLPDL